MDAPELWWMKNSELLIRGFGVQVPGGAPVLTWPYTGLGCPEAAGSAAMFAPRLLVSPDLVVRAGRPAQRDPCRWLYTA